MNKEDNKLIPKVLKRNAVATKTLYDRHEVHWFQICLRYSKNRSDAQDMFQEGVLLIFSKLNQFNAERGNFINWSNKIIVNTALQFLKKNHWNQSFKDLELADQKIDWSENILSKLNTKEIIGLIQQLPLGYRVVFNMFEIEGFSHQEIANALNISIGTSKSQLYKAKKQLQQKLIILI